MKNFFFSFIIPTFNRENYLKKTINSLLKQKYKFFEIIVIDDGSTDNTQQFIKNLKNSKIKYFYQENLERGKARNFGASKARGDYINYFDSDDIAYADHLQLANNILQKKKADVMHLGHHIILNNKIVKTNNPEGLLNNKILFGNIMLPISTFISRKISKEFFFVEDRRISGSEDYIYWLDISKKYKIYGFPQVTSALTMHNGRSMLTTTATKTENRILKTIDYIEHKIKFKKYKIQLIKGNCFMLIALEFSIEKNYKKTFEYIKYIFFKCPIYFLSVRFFVILRNLIF
jgi:glycosyltransferase involved in cell wall biosynthesis